MTYIIIALLALVVLVVIVLFFTGGMQKIFGQAAEVGEVTAQQKTLWRQQCALYCTTDKKEFCDHEFEFKDEKEKVTTYVCNMKKAYKSGINLGVECDTIEAGCSGIPQ